MERWLPVVGYEGRYEVSDLGVVRSLPRLARTWYGQRVVPGKVMKATVKQHGYLEVTLSAASSGKSQQYWLVHRLVLLAFVGAPAKGQECCHADGNRANAVLTNLSWGTKLDNMRDQYSHGTRIAGNKHPLTKLTDEIVSIIRTSEETGVALARRFNVNPTTICKVRRRYTHITVLGDKLSA